jgi:uncharacterized membrane protein
MSSHSNDLVLFLGHLHPMLVHLPIGSLVLLGVLEVLARLPRFKDKVQSQRVILGFATAASAAAAGCGWLLSQSGGYDPQLLYWHRLTGFGVVGACAMTLLLCGPNQPRACRVSLLATLTLLVVAGHFGGEITHGRGFFTRYAPAPLRWLLGEKSRPKPPSPPPADMMQWRLFVDVVQPILQRRCSSCHGPEKQKADLRLDGLERLLQGGKSGPAIVAGKANESPMIQRLLLPPSHDDHMPPEDKPQPTPAEIGLLQWWINSGASDEETIGGLKPGADVLRMLESVPAISR